MTTVQIIALTPEQLRAIIAEGVAEAIEAQQPPSDWTDLEGIAAHLVVSTPTIRRLCDSGLPHVYVGSHRRFSRRAVDAWLTEHGKDAMP